MPSSPLEPQARPWFRRLLIGSGILIALLIVGVIIGTIWLNSFIHSDSFRHEVEARASQTLGGPVEIKQIDLGFLGAVKLEGLGAKLATEHGTIGALVANINCSYSLWPLLSRQVDIDALNLKNPEMVLTQQPPSAASARITRASPDETTAAKVPPFQFSLRSATITNGHLMVKDVTGATKADLLGIDVKADTGGYFTGQDVTGTTKVKTILLPQNITATDFSSSFLYNNNGTLQARTFQATAFSGTISGDYTLDTTGPSLLTVKTEHIDLAALGQAATPDLATKMSGALDLQSTWHQVETGQLTGEGDAQIADGKLEGLVLLHELATALKLPALSNPDLKSVTTHFLVSHGETRFNSLVVKSTAFDMTGSGVIGPKGELDADMILIFHADTMKQIPGIAAAVFSKLPDGGGTIPFHLSGTIAVPQSDTLTQLFITGSKIQKTISKTIKNIFN